MNERANATSMGCDSPPAPFVVERRAPCWIGTSVGFEAGVPALGPRPAPGPPPPVAPDPPARPRADSGRAAAIAQRDRDPHRRVLALID